MTIPADQIYPTWRYHAELPPRLIRHAAEDVDLNDGWADTPAAFIKAEPAAEVPVDESVVETAPVLKAEDIAADLYAANAETVIGRINHASDLAILMLMDEVERGNPNHAGGRKSVLSALKQRIAAVKPATA